MTDLIMRGGLLLEWLYSNLPPTLIDRFTHRLVDRTGSNEFKPPRSRCCATLFPKYTTRGDEISNKVYFPEDGTSGKSGALGSNPGKLMFRVA
jgi:hypothetical protein